jgi:uncharacterized membrane protein
MPVSQQQTIRVLTVNAMFIALIATLGIAFGFIPLFFGLFSITILHIPVLVGAALLNVRSAIIFGLTFGVISWIVSLTSPLVGPADLIFNNPLISIFPRILFGLTSGMLFLFVKKLKGKLVYVGYGFMALVATLLHTIFVLIMIWILPTILAKIIVIVITEIIMIPLKTKENFKIFIKRIQTTPLNKLFAISLIQLIYLSIPLLIV